MPKKIHDGLKKRCGCPKRSWPKCAHPWWFGFHHDGREYRFSLAKFTTARDGAMSKTEAESVRDRLRIEIRAGLLTTTGERAAMPADPSSPLTFGVVADRYLDRHVHAPGRRDNARQKQARSVRQLCEVLVEGPAGTRVRLAEKTIATVTKADIDAIGDERRAALAEGRAGVTRLAEDATKPEGDRLPAPERARLAALASVAQRSGKGGEVGINRLIARLRHLFNWAVGEGYIAATPFVRNGVSVVRLSSGVESARTRRLVGDEETRLLQHSGPHLKALIIAALSTGCRLGELLSLQWSQVQVNAKGEPVALVLVAEKTKTSETRVVPVGGRLRAVLDMRRLDADGQPHGPTAFVFGHVETGEQVTTIKTAWGGTCRRAGISGLHFHDLRREFCCRLMETGASLHDVKEFAGHANVTTTSRYLKSSPLRLAMVLAQMEAADKTGEVLRPNTDLPSGDYLVN